MYSPGGIRGGGRAAVRHKLAKICRIRLMGGLVRERKCSLVASANYCGQCVGEPFLSQAYFPIISFAGTQNSERARASEKRTNTDSGCVYIGWRLPRTLSLPMDGREEQDQWGQGPCVFGSGPTRSNHRSSSLARVRFFFIQHAILSF